MPLIEFIYFDVGGTLIVDQMSRPQAFWYALDAAGFVCEPAAVRAGCAAADETIAQGFLDKSLTDRESLTVWRHALYRSLGIETDPALIDRMIGEHLGNLTWGVVDPEAREVLDSLRGRRVRLGVISNWEKGLTRFLRDKGLFDPFDVILSSGEVGVSKPHPDFFREALDRAGTEPARTALVGDSLCFDILPARAAGMMGILLDRWDLEPAFDGLRIRRLSELPSVLFAEKKGTGAFSES